MSKDISKLETLFSIIKQHCILCDGDDELDEEIKKLVQQEKILPIITPPHLLFLNSGGNGSYRLPLTREQYDILKGLFY